MLQILLQGHYTLQKVKALTGDKNPKEAQKNSLRSFYGTDRYDNAFFVSETFTESHSLLSRINLKNKLRHASSGRNVIESNYTEATPDRRAEYDTGVQLHLLVFVVRLDFGSFLQL